MEKQNRWGEPTTAKDKQHTHTQEKPTTHKEQHIHKNNQKHTHEIHRLQHQRPKGYLKTTHTKILQKRNI